MYRLPIPGENPEDPMQGAIPVDFRYRYDKHGPMMQLRYEEINGGFHSKDRKDSDAKILEAHQTLIGGNLADTMGIVNEGGNKNLMLGMPVGRDAVTVQRVTEQVIMPRLGCHERLSDHIVDASNEADPNRALMQLRLRVDQMIERRIETRAILFAVQEGIRVEIAAHLASADPEMKVLAGRLRRLNRGKHLQPETRELFAQATLPVLTPEKISGHLNSYLEAIPTIAAEIVSKLGVKSTGDFGEWNSYVDEKFANHGLLNRGGPHDRAMLPIPDRVKSIGENGLCWAKDGSEKPCQDVQNKELTYMAELALTALVKSQGFTIWHGDSGVGKTVGMDRLMHHFVEKMRKHADMNVFRIHGWQELLAVLTLLHQGYDSYVKSGQLQKLRSAPVIIFADEVDYHSVARGGTTGHGGEYFPGLGWMFEQIVKGAERTSRRERTGRFVFQRGGGPLPVALGEITQATGRPSPLMAQLIQDLCRQVIEKSPMPVTIIGTSNYPDSYPRAALSKEFPGVPWYNLED